MEIAKCKLQNRKAINKEELQERLLNFAVRTIKLLEKMDKNFVGRQIAGQLIRSASSAGANYEEACGAESRSDFVHKLQIVLKELRESAYWFRLIKKLELIPAQEVSGVSDECKELSNIIGKSILTAKENKKV